MTFPQKVGIREVGPRDGLQNESVIVPTRRKVEWMEKLLDAGIRYLEVSSFVSPKWIPALADAEDVFRMLPKRTGVTYAALVPNAKGLERALQADVDEVSLFVSASDTHNRRNVNRPVEQSLRELRPVAEEALAAGKSVRGYISMVFGCPYEGKISIGTVERTAHALLDMGVRELSLGDTIGIAHPRQVTRVIRQLKTTIPSGKMALHFHNTRGLALANTMAALEQNIQFFDGAAGGLGGCPYAQGAAGNIATEDLVYLLEQSGIQTGINVNQLVQAAGFIKPHIGGRLSSFQASLNEEGEDGA
ncbi:hydroxymethylglutaryl-CoA lyase [Alkalicoccus urumqiensis]|uniref:Hydroxymethylglutaryl-CoA lyase n=1 Tax=Alkalicoccus urumqiensis TaxID=1548213 RepID=A0A2P6MEH5_ALKUR|nr:hydroxymethylglutaryl-CoA lyase [Alkalicoccus urumqiensis]PRO64657.1 hydroxymethylglutaryl-CoA lyase [Alkalicoccus urumqiensis]